MTSVQQVNFHPGLRKYIFANWAWISYDGNPRPDHTADERNERTGHQRTQLTLVEGDTPWGPWSVFYRDDNWHGPDGSMGGCESHARPRWIRWLGLTKTPILCRHAGVPSGVDRGRRRRRLLDGVHAVLRQPAAALEPLQLQRAEGCGAVRCSRAPTGQQKSPALLRRTHNFVYNTSHATKVTHACAQPPNTKSLLQSFSFNFN